MKSNCPKCSTENKNKGARGTKDKSKPGKPATITHYDYECRECKHKYTQAV